MPTLNQNGSELKPAPSASRPEDMSDPFYITTPSGKTEITISGNQGEMSFTVTNKTGTPLRTHFNLGRAASDGDDSQRDPGLAENSPLKKWLGIKTNEPVPTIPGGNGTVQVVVTVTAPPDTEGPYSFRLLAGAEPKPEEDFSASANITFQLSKGEVRRPKTKWWVYLLIGLGVLAIVGGILAVVLWPRGVPDVVGKPLAEAKRELEKAGLQVKVNETYSPGKPEGTVLGEEPPAGPKMPGDKVEVLNVATTLPSVPCVEGLELAAAQMRLRLAGVRGNPQPYAGASNLPPGTVISQNPRVNVCTPNPQGLRVAPGTTVILLVKQ
jgi:hypothetical protein